MLTPSQKTTLKAHILATSDLNELPNSSDGNFELAVRLNQPASPDYYVWKTSLEVSEVMQNGIDWTRVDNLTVGKARIIDWMMRTGTLNPSKATVRAGFNAAFTAQADEATRLSIFGHCQRLASRVEKLLVASGSGTTTDDDGVGPSTMGFVGPISGDDVQAARNS